jgi:xyloglucan-specific exo-beta-1,4-glucanase
VLSRVSYAAAVAAGTALLGFARTDIGGAYRWDAAARRWIPLLDFTGFNDWNELGVESIAADPVNPAKVRVATGEYTCPWASPPNGEVLRSTDEGRTWIRINDDAESYGRIGQTTTGDPNVFGRVYLGTNGRGILYAGPKTMAG